MTPLWILSAGVVMSQVKKAVDRFNSGPDGQAVASFAGSVDCIRRMQGGEPCDLLILADNAIIDSMMMPVHTEGYHVFAGNRMVLVSRRDDRSISSDNWVDALLEPAATFGHFDPTGDPGGYRAVMACMLADGVRPGLGRQLLEHPGRTVVTPASAPVDYIFTYGSMPAGKKLPYARLPAVMDLSDPALDDHYRSAVVDLDGDGRNVVRGSAIRHALTVPRTAASPDLAHAFITRFLETDFEAEGFLPRRQAVGRVPFGAG